MGSTLARILWDHPVGAGRAVPFYHWFWQVWCSLWQDSMYIDLSTDETHRPGAPSQGLPSIFSCNTGNPSVADPDRCCLSSVCNLASATMMESSMRPPRSGVSATQDLPPPPQLPVYGGISKKFADKVVFFHSQYPPSEIRLVCDRTQMMSSE